MFFTASGTASNVLAIGALLRSHEAVLCTRLAHLWADECGAPEKQTGCKIVAVPDDGQGKLPVSAIEEFVASLPPMVHRAQPRLVSITQPTEVGTVYTTAEVAAIAECAHRHGLLLHMDGARLYNAAASLGVGLRALTRDLGVDVLSLGGSKNGLINAEAVVLFQPAPALPYVRKQGMQLLSKMRFIAAQFAAMVGTDLWQRNAAHANAMAALLGQQLAALAGVELVYPVQANMCFARLPGPAVAQQLQQHFACLRTGDTVRLVTAFDTDPADVARAVALVRRLLLLDQL